MSNHHRQRPSLFWPLLLIGVGVTLLLSNLGILPENSFNILWRFWPLGLVIIGLDILLGRRSALGSIITSILVLLLFGGVIGFIFLARNTPELISELGTASFQSATINTPLEDAESATVTIDWTGAPARLYALSDSNKLIDGHIDYAGNLYFDVKRDGRQVDVDLDTRVDGFFIADSGSRGSEKAWELGLHPAVRYDLRLDASSGPADYDFSRLKIDGFNIDAGSGPLNITLPESGRVDGAIDGGSGLITLILPDSLEAKIILDDNYAPFFPGDRFKRDRVDEDADNAVWVTGGFTNADNYIVLEIDPGSGAIKVE